MARLAPDVHSSRKRRPEARSAHFGLMCRVGYEFSEISHEPLGCSCACVRALAPKLTNARNEVATPHAQIQLEMWILLYALIPYPNYDESLIPLQLGREVHHQATNWLSYLMLSK